MFPIPLSSKAIAAVVAVAVLIGASVWWLAAPGGSAPASPTVVPASPADRRVLDKVSGFFAPATCSVIGMSGTCQISGAAKPGVPLAATFEIAADAGELRQEFDAIVVALAVRLCPGNIESPGPWRRGSRAPVAAGTIVCGFRNGAPTLAWTTDAERLVVSIQGRAGGTSLEQLYAWWRLHA